nr:TraM recognition domain-containing protein [Lachnospiraceae bacterium]
LLFNELYRQARFFGGRLPLDVGFWFDEFANIKMPNNFDKILATCRSRGVYCVPIPQSLAQLKTLFADGAWEGVAGNCDTFLYLGGNEASTYEYVSKLLGKWTIDKRTSGESKGSSGSYSENYDVLGRELMLEYEIRLLPDDECILFVRGEHPIRDKKWFSWEHQEYENARKYGAYLPDREMGDAEPENENCQFISNSSLEYLKMQENQSEGIHICGMDVYEFMMMDMDAVMGKVHTVADEQEKSALIRPDMIRKAIEVEAKRNSEEQRERFERDFPEMSLLDIFSSRQISRTRREVIRELIQAKAEDETIKSIVSPKLTEAEVQEKKRAWMEMRGEIVS